jgi:hypothetical protein
VFDNKNISSRNRNQWEEIISGAILTYSGLTGTFQVAEEIRGTLPVDSIAIAIINTDDGSSMNIDADHNDFRVGDTITGQTSGATATVVSTNTGSDIQHNYDRSSVILTTGTGATDSAIRSTHRYHAYVPGKSNLTLFTFVLGSPVTNVKRRLGIFDELNGIFFEQTESEYAFVIRTSTSGSVSDANRVIQSNWNVDKFDGNGPSGIIIDLTKAQILFIEYQWLGVGRVRVGFDINGQIFIAHEFRNANTVDVVYMKTPTLPVRYDITNTGVTSSQTTFEEICCSVVSEGGYSLPGLEYSTPITWTDNRSISVRTPLIAIRLKNEYPAGEPNRRTIKYVDVGAFVRTNDCLLEVAHIHEPVDITATWNDVGGGSSAEFSTDITAVTGRPEHKIDHDAIEAGGGIGKGSRTLLTGEFINLHSFLSQNFDSTNSQMFVIYGTPRTGSSVVLPHITFLEYD